MKSEWRKFGRALIFAVLFATMAFVSVGCASTATQYVNLGESIQTAVNTADPGDTIVVRDGTYTENVDVDKRLTIQSENGSANCIVQAADSNDHVFEVTAYYVNISGFTVKGATVYPKSGIYLGSDVDHCNITDNKALDNYYGIYLYRSSSNTITDNTANESIFLSSSSSNTITNNTLNSNSCGISLYYSNDNYITGNTLYGISLYRSTYNTLRSNTMENSGIYITGDDSITSGIIEYYNTHDIDTSNIVNGKPVYYWKDKVGGTIPAGAGQIILANCTGVTVKNQNASYTNVGIELAYSTHCNIIDNIVNENGYGIWLMDWCSYNTITGNTVNSNRCIGIKLRFSCNNNAIADNTVNENDEGICLENSCNNNAITDNIVNENGEYGIYLIRSSNYNTITNNTANLNGQSGLLDRAGIYLQQSCDNTIVSNAVNSNNYHGISLWHSNNNYITDNTANENDYKGIFLCNSNNNTLIHNSANLNNYWGIRLYDSSNNKIYLNNFINNTYNVDSYSSTSIWNSTEKITYPYNSSTYTNYLGNYWDDYKGSDKDSTGIGDMPYDIYEPCSIGEKDDFDYHPLMEPWENYFGPTPTNIFDTGSPLNPYSSIMGNHTGTIKPNHTVTATKLYTYPCVGTGGHTEYVKIWNSTGWNVTATWNGYTGDWHNISFNETFVLYENKTYNYTIRTGSYPQIIHKSPFNATGGTITCDKFIDANGRIYYDWIPAIRLE